ncbi:MAG: TIGR04282 family arsenosugar biosynthesis glycosyltransferase [Nitrospirae bacterium]|nr:TIGR04282 family arsenosugar biosynthesis glycosyltransferase [Nitrospirota bacterium]
MKTAALIIFAKTPIPGKVKTRLQPDISPEEGLKIYKSFVREIAGRCSKLKGVDKFLGCAPTKDDDFLKGLAATHWFEMFNQRGKDLGARILNAFKDHFKKGYKKVIIIGTDSPTIPVKFIKKAFSELDKNDFVLGPCCDGGYYLIGARKVFPKVFDNIPWDTSEVLIKTIDRLDASRIKFFLLPFWYDVDTIKDLRFFKKHLKYLGKQQT